MPANISEPLGQPQPKERPSEPEKTEADPESNESAKEGKKTEVQIKEVIKEVTVIKEVPAEKIIYRDNPEQAEIIRKQKRTIEDLEIQIAVLNNKIRELNEQIEWLLSRLEREQPSGVTEENSEPPIEDTASLIKQNYKITYLGYSYINWSLYDAENPAVDCYYAWLLIDTAVPASQTRIEVKIWDRRNNALLGSSPSTNDGDKLSDYGVANERFAKICLPIAGNEMSVWLKISVGGNTAVDDRRAADISIPAVPDFETKEGLHEWLTNQNKQTAAQLLETCEKYRNRQFTDRYACLKNSN